MHYTVGGKTSVIGAVSFAEVNDLGKTMTLCTGQWILLGGIFINKFFCMKVFTLENFPDFYFPRICSFGVAPLCLKNNYFSLISENTLRNCTNFLLFSIKIPQVKLRTPE